MSVEPTHGVYQPTGSPALDLSWDDLLPIDYLQLTGGSTLKVQMGSPCTRPDTLSPLA